MRSRAGSTRACRSTACSDCSGISRTTRPATRSVCRRCWCWSSHGGTLTPRILAFCGCLLGVTLLFTTFAAIMLTMMVAVTAATMLARERRWVAFATGAIAGAIPLALAVLVARSLHYLDLVGAVPRPRARQPDGGPERVDLVPPQLRTHVDPRRRRVLVAVRRRGRHVVSRHRGHHRRVVRLLFLRRRPRPSERLRRLAGRPLPVRRASRCSSAMALQELWRRAGGRARRRSPRRSSWRCCRCPPSSSTSTTRRTSRIRTPRTTTVGRSC